MRLVERGRPDLTRSRALRRIVVPVAVLCCLAVALLAQLHRSPPSSGAGGAAGAGDAGNLSSRWSLTQRPAALFVGDSYTFGTGSTAPPDTGYACLTAAAMGWTCMLDAQGATGYLNNGHLLSRKYTPFTDRLAADARTFRPDVVVVDGGRNDGRYPIEQVAAAVKAYLRAVHAAFPRARIVLIAPAYVSSTPANYGFGVELAARLQELGRPYRAVVVEPLGHAWFGSGPWRDLVEKDGIHPDQAAHTHFADVLTERLKAAGLGRLKAPARSL